MNASSNKCPSLKLKKSPISNLSDCRITTTARAFRHL